jgi:hypothetical protein
MKRFMGWAGPVLLASGAVIAETPQVGQTPQTIQQNIVERVSPPEPLGAAKPAALDVAEATPVPTARVEGRAPYQLPATTGAGKATMRDDFPPSGEPTGQAYPAFLEHSGQGHPGPSGQTGTGRLPAGFEPHNLRTGGASGIYGTMSFQAGVGTGTFPLRGQDPRPAAGAAVADLRGGAEHEDAAPEPLAREARGPENFQDLAPAALPPPPGPPPPPPPTPPGPAGEEPRQVGVE